MIPTKQSQLVFILPFHPSKENDKKSNPIGTHHLFPKQQPRGAWQHLWGGRTEGNEVPLEKPSRGDGLLNPATENALLKTLSVWQFDTNQVRLSPGIRALNLHQKSDWSIEVDGKEHPVTPGWMRIVDTTQDIALVALQLELGAMPMTTVMKIQRMLSTSHRSSGWTSDDALVQMAPDEQLEKGVLHFKRKSSKDGPLSRFQTTVNRLLLAIANDVFQQAMEDASERVRVFSSRNLGFHATQLDVPDTNSWPAVDLKLEHHGYRMMESASPSWGRNGSTGYRCDSPEDRHSYWAKHDAVLLCITGDSTWVQGDLLANWSQKCDQWFLSFILIQSYLFRANELEDQLKETVANNTISNKILQREEKKFEEREWEYLQLNWTLNHKLLHMESKRRSFHESLREVLGVEEVRSSLDNQSNLIRSWYTQSFQNVTKNFVALGATLGIVTGLLGINVSGLTSDNTGLSYHWWWTMLSVMAVLYAYFFYKSLFANPTRKSIFSWRRKRHVPERNPESY